MVNKGVELQGKGMILGLSIWGTMYIYRIKIQNIIVRAASAGQVIICYVMLEGVGSRFPRGRSKMIGGEGIRGDSFEQPLVSVLRGHCVLLHVKCGLYLLTHMTLTIAYLFKLNYLPNVETM